MIVIVAMSLLLISCVEEDAPAVATLWITQNELDQLPISGDAWDNVYAAAQNNTGNPDLANQDDKTDVHTMAKALVYARIGDQRYAEKVRSTLQRLVENHPVSQSRNWDALGCPSHLFILGCRAEVFMMESAAVPS